MKVDIYNAEKKYDIIYADPPWAYHDTLGGNAKMGAMPYSTMTQEELCAMPIYKIAKKDSVLFMWATMPKLQEALDTIKAWGFKYKTCAFVGLNRIRKAAESMQAWVAGCRATLNCAYLRRKGIRTEYQNQSNKSLWHRAADIRRNPQK